MSRKRKSNSSLNLLIIAFILLAAAAVFFYATDPDFKEKVNSVFAEQTFTNQAGTENTDYTESNQEQPQEESENQQKEAETGVLNTEQTAQKDNTKTELPLGLEIPACAGKENKEDHQIRNFEYYSICYRESYEQAEWSAYLLTDEMLQKNTSRTDDFRSDPMISTGSASPADYKGSGYDRGHLTPAADMAFSKEAMSETFFMSNMSPQAAGFNRGIWKDLEATVRTWAAKFGRIYIISGPVFDKSASEYKYIGEDEVSVPEYYYKIILAPLYSDDEDRESYYDAADITALAFIFPNEKCESQLWDYAVTIDEIESRTGIDFFPLLDDDKENYVESHYSIEYWQ